MFLYAALLVAAAVIAIPLTITPPPGPETSFSESFWEGWRLVVGGAGRPLLQLATVDSVEGFFASAAPILITLLATATYHQSATGYGVLFTAFVVGGVGAGLALGHWNPRARVGIVMGAALGATGAAYIIAVALPSLLWLGVIAWFGIGFASAAYLDAESTFFRGAIAPEKIGRLVSNMYLFPGITSSIGALVISAVAVTGESVHLGVAVGGGLIAAGVLGLALPRVRRMAY